MPLYEYQCLDCGDTFQKRRPFSNANDPAACVHCRSEHTKKIIGAVMVLSGGAKSAPQSTAPQSGGHSGCGCGSCGCGMH